jgi:hypothetical protein
MARGRKGTEYYMTEIPDLSISFDFEAFDRSIRGHGCRLIHFQSMRCPVGMVDLDDNRRPHSDHAGCSNGFIYREMGQITALFTSNSTHQDSKDIGFVDSSSVTVTFPRGYDNSDLAFYPAQFDRFYIAEDNIVVPTWEVCKANGTGVDRLNFPVVSVERLVDNRGQDYKEGDDFTVCGGKINWTTSGLRPAPDLETGNGGIVSVRYLYRPYFYLARAIHELRIAQVDDPMTAERRLVRMPQMAVLNREWMFRNEAQDSESRTPNSSRQAPPPPDGGIGGEFGPR